MIELNVADYCQECSLFEADTSTIVDFNGNAYTIIRCKDEEKCAAIYKHIRAHECGEE